MIGIAIGLAIPVTIVALSVWAGVVDDRNARRAKDGGCICTRTALVHYKDSECPYCNPENDV